MRIIISPAKKMNIDTDTFPQPTFPIFLEETSVLMEWIRALSFPEAQKLWQCNDKIAELNYRRFQDMNLRRNLTPALVSYEGIQYQYMAPEVFTRPCRRVTPNGKTGKNGIMCRNTCVSYPGSMVC